MDFVTNILSYVGWVVLAIMILVFVHELGHFLFAKLFKMRVDKFSVGFPPKIIGKTVGETEYVIGLTPLGGYVKIAGMVDESMDTEALKSEPKEWEFRAKPVWQRMIVITAGVAFNMVLAAFVFITLKAFYGDYYLPPVGSISVEEGTIAFDMGLRTGDNILSINGRSFDGIGPLTGLGEMLLADRFVLSVEREGTVFSFTGPEEIMTRLNESGGKFGVKYDPALIGTLAEGSAALDAGLLPGDQIEAMDGERVVFWSEMTRHITESEGEPVAVIWRRPDSLAGIIPPAGIRIPDSTGDGILYETNISPRLVDGTYMFGISQIRRFRTYDFTDAISAGFSETWMNTRLIFVSLKRVFTGQENFRANVGGPIAIAKVTKEAADAGAQFFWRIVAMLSITLAIINILPIPALDGGHLVFLIYEGISRREPSLKLRMAMQQVGMVILLAFMAFVIFNDILKL